jgi:tripeptide aminopeptidase
MNFFRDPKPLLTETQLVERFVRYARVDTQSDETKACSPTTQGQLELARLLIEELCEMGISDAMVDCNGYVTATIDGDASKGTIGLIAHLDTSPAAPGSGVMPTLHPDYDGGDIRLKEGVTIVADENPELGHYVGDTIITSDGTTLLGADDKAGIAVIMAAAKYLTDHPEIPRPRIRIGFTPDEEIGRGATRFPFQTFCADMAYTIDGSVAGEINVETFEAYSARIEFEGIATHPGHAKGKLVNALKLMARFIAGLPEELSPEATEGREGFIHPVTVKGDATICWVELILRDFEAEKVQSLAGVIETSLNALKKSEPRLKTNLTIKQTYPNMYTFLKEKPDIVARLEEAVSGAGITPVVIPVRGGTDGSVLTKKGLVCPNIFAGGINFHDKREWVADRAMGLSLCTVLNLIVSHAK